MPFTMRRNHQISNETWRRHAFPCACDATNQLVCSTNADGKTTECAYGTAVHSSKDGEMTAQSGTGYYDQILE